MAFNNFVPTLSTVLTDRLHCLLLRTSNTFLMYVWLPLGVQYVTEQLDRKSLCRLIISFFARSLGFDSLPIHVKYIAGSSTRKVYFQGTSFFPNQAISPMFHTYLPRLRNTPQDEKSDKCLGTFKQRNYLSNNVKALVRKTLCRCLLHNSTSISRTGFHTLHFPLHVIQIAANPREAFTYIR